MASAKPADLMDASDRDPLDEEFREDGSEKPAPDRWPPVMPL